MHWTQKPTIRLCALVLVAAIFGGGWWYLSKRAACEQQIAFVPSQPLVGGNIGEHYTLRGTSALSNIGGGAKYATHKEAMSVCLWR